MSDIWIFFAFPLNLFFAALWMLFWVWLYKLYPDTRAVRFLLSPSATVSSIVLLIISCLWIGISGDRDFVESIIFVVVLLYIQTVLFLITLRGWRRPDGVIRWRFLLLHIGLLLAVGSGFWGMPDSKEYRVQLGCGQVSKTSYEMDGRRSALQYEVGLKSLITEYSGDGKPINYEAVISIDDVELVTLSVNNPYNVRFGEDIYLASINSDTCVLQIVKEPWRYFALGGIIMLLAGAFMLFIKGPRR